MKENKNSTTKDKILKTALNLFYNQGIRTTGVDTLIAKSEVAKMTFYKYFPTKQHLILEVLRLADELWFASFKETVETKKDPKDRLISIFDFLETWFKSPSFRGCAYINTTAEFSDKHSKECLFSMEHKKKLSLYIEETAKEAGIKKYKQLAEQFLILIDGAIVRSQMEGNSKSANNAKAIAKMILENI